MKYAFIKAHRPEFSVRVMCRMLCVHPSGFYAWLKRPFSRRAVEDIRQTGLLKDAWEESGKVYGYRKLHDDLRDQPRPGKDSERPTKVRGLILKSLACFAFAGAVELLPKTIHWIVLCPRGGCRKSW
jgi:hypothetical protein